MKQFKRLLSLALSAMLLLSSLSAGIGAAFALGFDDGDVVSQLSFAAVSDIHYYPQSYTGDNCEAWQEYCAADSKQYNEAHGITRAALDSIAKRALETGIEYLLIPGDLTKDSEYMAHVELAAMLEEFEAETGIQVIVTNGNHDINVNDACTFENGVMETAPSITQAQFKEVYKNLGYDLAVSEYIPPEGTSQGGLSYAADMGDYAVIVIDSNKYDPDTPMKQQTDGVITEDLMDWILSTAKQAQRDGKTVMAMIHHSLAAHIKLEPSVTYAFCVDDYVNVAETLADAGIKFAFSGHQHSNDIACVTSDSGNTLYDCEVGALTGFPNQIRELSVTTYASGESEMSYSLLDCDYAHEVEVGDTVYEKPFKVASFAMNFGGRQSADGNADTKEFFMGIIKNFLLPYVEDIARAGGVNEFLKTMDIDLAAVISSFLEPYIGDGIKVFGLNIFSSDNIMWFVEDLFSQIEELYINDTDALLDLLEGVVDRLCSFEVSSVPCTKFINSYGFGDENAPGTLGDLILTAMWYWYTGNEDISDDEFMLDTLEQLEKGDTVRRLIDELIDIILNDLLDGAILSRLDIRLEKLTDESTCVGKSVAQTIKSFTSRFLKGDVSYMNLINTVFGFGILPYENLYDILDKLFIEEYMTDSQYEAIGAEVCYCVSDFVTDENPQAMGDNDVTYSTRTVTVTPTTQDFRLPSMIAVTLADSQTSVNISWFTKETVDGSDIEIYKADEFTSFKGEANTRCVTAEVNTQLVTRSYPGIDLGVFGLFNYEFELNRHTATLSDLEPGAKYVYKLGDAEKGWWSDMGVIIVPDGSDKVTFLHMTDSQSQNEAQYLRSWTQVVNSAFELYPDAAFIMNTGDMVDSGTNNKQWQWLLDLPSEKLMSTFLMPATGNHEDSSGATVGNFLLSNLPEQSTETGVYYSFDYNNVHIAVLNTNDLDKSDALSSEQINWLRSDMLASDAQWKIVAMHKAVYSNGSHYDDDDVSAMREQLSTLMPELGVDLVLQGHDHVYMRTYALDGNKVVDTRRVYLEYNGKKYKTDESPSGTSYVISGTSGVKVYNAKSVSETDKLFPRAEVIRSVDASMFSAITIDSGILYFDAYTVSGGKAVNVDSFAIRKDASQGVYAGDCEDVSAQEANASKTTLSQLISSILSFLQRLFKALERIFGHFGDIL